MFYVLQNESTADLRRVPILLTDAATGTTAQTGIALIDIYPYVNINGGAFAGGAGSVAEAGYGQYYYQFDATEVATLGLAGIHITAAGCRNYDAIAQVAAFNMYSGGGAGITAGDVWNYSGTTEAATVKETLESANTNAANASAQTGASAIRDAVWDTNVSYLTAPQAGFALYQAASGATTAAEQVWNYDISAVSGAGLAGTQLNLAALPSGAGITSGDVWSYADRTITGGSVTSIVDPVEITTSSMTGIAGTVWSTDISGYVSLSAGFDLTEIAAVAGFIDSSISDVPQGVWTYDISAISTAGSAGTQLNLAALPSGAGITSGDVWTYVDRTITGGIADTVTAVTNTVDISTGSVTDIWSEDVSAYSTPSAGFDLTQAASGVGITAGDVWEYDISAISTAGTAGSQVNLAALPGGVGISAYDVWSFDYLTGGVVVNSSAERLEETRTYADLAQNNTNSIGEQVWTYDPAGGGPIPAAGSYLIQAGDATTTAAESVWTYATREITGGTATTVTNAVLVDPASMTGIAGTVWNTDVSAFLTPSAGYDLTQAASAIGITAGDVWSYATRTITGGIADTVTTVSSPVEVSTTSMSGIANTVWSTDVSVYTNPSAGFDITNIAYIPQGVWEYDISAISTAGTAGTQLNIAASGGAGITVGDVSDAVWNSLTSSYTTFGTFGYNTLRSENAGVAGTVSLWTGGALSGIFADTYRIDEDYNAAIALKNVLTGIGSTITGNITGSVSGSVGSVTSDVNVSTTSMSGIANTVWSTDVSGYTSPSAGFDLSNASSGVGITAGDVWEYDISAISTAGSAGTQLNLAALPSGSGITAGDVWDYSSRTITGGSVTSVVDGVTVTTNNDKTGYELSGTQSFNLTGNITGDLSGSVGSVTADVNVSTGSMTGIASTVWDYVTRTLTSAAGVTAGDIWEYDISAITTAGTAGSQVNLAALPSGAGISAFDVWDYTLLSSGVSADSTLGNADDQATGANTNTNSPTLEANVWGYADRTITGGSVTSVVNGVTVTTNNDKTGYELSGTQSFNLTGNITGSVSGSVGSVTGSVDTVTNPVTVSTASMSGIANTVWTAATKTITGGTVDTVTNPVTVATASMSGIANTVWTYGTRTLTSGAGATAGDIWTYNIASITASGTAGATLNDASVSGSVVTIVNGPYRLTSIAEGTDGRIDILAESVQTIQLNCLDGFGQPFNVTGYAVVVNVYDVSGALTVTYTPTVDFASSGIVSFDIDTDVTGTTGRYTLVVELTAGLEVVQLGPLEILVRPL
jgi:hypothetical protein